MSGEHTEGRKKHRHDLGQEDHGPVYAAGTTRGIQVVLGLWIALTFVLIGWAVADASQSRQPTASAPTTATAPSHDGAQ